MEDDARRNYTALQTLVINTHAETPKYSSGLELYPWIDLQGKDGEYVLKSIYSGKVFDPIQAIEEAFHIETSLEAAAERLRVEVASERMSLEEDMALVEATAPYNGEHVVPQSWFGKKEPMRGDLHHLFTCESGCNSFRGNTPYWVWRKFLYQRMFLRIPADETDLKR